MDTDYLATLHRPDVELVADDAVECITETGVRTKSGREVRADAIVLATGFEVSRMLFPMEIIGQKDISLNEHWDEHHQGNAQAYFGTCVPGFPKYVWIPSPSLKYTSLMSRSFFTLMGPNTVTGHLSVIYTVECQINFALRLIKPILESLHSSQRGVHDIAAVTVKPEAAKRQISWMQSRLSKLVWSSGCTSWALDPKTGANIAMYPEYQFVFWLRSVFIPVEDFEYVITGNGQKSTRSLLIGGWKSIRQFGLTLGLGAAVTLAVIGAGGGGQVRGVMERVLKRVAEEGRRLLQAR